jgi:hypothetical protein
MRLNDRPSVPAVPKAEPSLERPDVGKSDEGERQQMQDDPDRLRPQLQAADEGDVRHQWMTIGSSA